MLLPPLPQAEAEQVEIVRGPNIQPLPIPEPPEEHLLCRVSLKAGDNITTDDITPASAEFSSMRSNIPMMSRYCYHNYAPDFAARARQYGKSILVGGENYGQGSSREHAAINPMFLGVKAVIAKSMARIHKNNLINHGVVPLLFQEPEDYSRVELGDELEIANFPRQIQTGQVTVYNHTRGGSFVCRTDLSPDEIQVVLRGGQLRYIRAMLQESARTE